MAFVHQQSCECLKSELDLFTVPPTQTSIESGTYVEYNPISTINDDTPIEFVVSGGGQDYIDLANTQLYVKAKIVKRDGTDIVAADRVGPVNLLLHSLFTEVDVKLNDTLITSTNNTYPYRSYLETLLSYGHDAKTTQLTGALFYKDEAGRFDTNNPHGEGVNSGLKKRNSFFKNGGAVELMGRLHADLFFQEKYLPNDVTIRIRLVRSRNTFCLMSSTPEEGFKVRILECKVYVRKIKLSPNVLVAHARALEVGNAKYPIRRAVCKTFTVPQGNLNFSQENLFTGQMPTRIVLGCVDNDAYNGVYDKSPFNFKHLNLSQLKIYLDGQQQQIRPLELNYAARNYLAGYMSLFSGTGKQFQDEGCHINREEYSGGYALYAFDLTPDIAEGDHFNLIKEGNVRVDVKFSEALPNTINVIAYGEFENIIEIDRTKNVLFDYSN